MKRGELWTVSAGVYASKPPPCLIIQDDLFDQTKSITVCPLTSRDVGVQTTRIALSPSPLHGLKSTSYVMTDKLTTVPRANLHQRIGQISPAELAAVERSVLVFLGFAR